MRYENAQSLLTAPNKAIDETLARNWDVELTNMRKKTKPRPVGGTKP